MTQDEMKRKAAEAAMEYVIEDEIIGVGTGSTVNHFIDCLARSKALYPALKLQPNYWKNMVLKYLI